jgi:hypothetical protein
MSSFKPEHRRNGSGSSALSTNPESVESDIRSDYEVSSQGSNKADSTPVKKVKQTPVKQQPKKKSVCTIF